MNRRDEAFALYKAPHIAEAITRNLSRMWLDLPATRDRGRAAIVRVIGPGHTLPDDVGPTDGVFSMAVNSALVPLAARGFTPDGFLCRESIDMSDHVRRAAESWTHKPLAVLDVGTHPATWDACSDLGLEVHWFIPASTQTFGLSAMTGEEPLYGGTSNVTAAVALAERWGAVRIELLGCSRAFSLDGRAYAAGSDWSTVKLERVEAATLPDGTVDHYVGHVSGTEAKERLHASSGQRPPLKVERVVPLAAIDGSRRWAPETVDGDREWLETFATRHGDHRSRHGGVDLYQHDPDVAIAGWGWAPRVEPSPSRADVTAEIRRQVEHARAIIAATRSGEPAVDVDGLIEGSALVDYAGVGDVIRVMQATRGRGPAVTVPAVCAAWEAAAARVEALALPPAPSRGTLPA